MTKHSQPIAVLGAGSWGSALALVLAHHNKEVYLWDQSQNVLETIKAERTNQRYLPGFKFPNNIYCEADLAKILAATQDILIAVPSHGFRALLEKIKKLGAENIRIVWGTKGFDMGTRQLLSQVVAEIFSLETPAAVLSGPSFAKEVAERKPTAISLSGNNAAFIQDLIAHFHSTHFRIYQNADFVGVQIFGAVKNVVAIAVGIADGLGLGANARAALVTRGLAEINRLNLALGGKPETVMSLAGVGDLVLTCTDDQSRNRRFGLAIGRGVSAKEALAQIGQAVEGFNNTKQVYDLAKSLKLDMPITEQLYLVLYHGGSGATAFENLLARAQKSEN